MKEDEGLSDTEETLAKKTKEPHLIQDNTLFLLLTWGIFE